MDIPGQEGLNAAEFETVCVRGISYPSVPTLPHNWYRVSFSPRSKAAGVWTNLSEGRAIPLHLIRAFVESYRVTLTKKRSLL
jgi:hypothetical protein